MPRKVTRDEILDSLCAPMVRACRHHKLTISSVVKVVKEGLGANENKVFYDKDRGKCIVGPDMIDHGKRLEAAAIASGFFGLKKEKIKVDAKHSGNITVNIRKFGQGNIPADHK
jgi:hypothetical protein